MNEHSFNVECDYCGHKFAVAKVGSPKTGAVGFEYARPYDVCGHEFYLTTYVCPMCGSTNVGQVDNDASLKLFREANDVMAKAMTIHSDKRRKELSESYKTTCLKLRKLRSELCCEVNGKTAVSPDGNKLEIKVSANEPDM